MKLQDMGEVLENCFKQLNRHALLKFQADLEQRERNPPQSYLGRYVKL